MTRDLKSLCADLVWWAPPVGWMMLIMWLSTDTFSAANTARVLVPSISRLAPWLTPAQIDLVHFLIRKSAHMGEYAVLGCLWFRALRRAGGWSPRRGAWWALQISVLWAVLDELHQATTLARTGAARDVVIDTVGAGIALAVLLTVAIWRGGARQRRTPWTKPVVPETVTGMVRPELP